MTSSGTFVEKLIRLNGVWKLVSLECIYDKDNLIPVVGSPTKTLVIEYPRESYKCLGYVLTLGGFTVDQNLPGWDRPDEAQRTLKAARDWIKI
jgi:hypothetical protein